MGKNEKKKKQWKKPHIFPVLCISMCNTGQKQRTKQATIFQSNIPSWCLPIYFFFFVSFSVLLFIRFATNGKFTLLSITTTTTIIIIISTLHLALPTVVRYILHRLDRMAAKLYLVGTRVHLILDTTTILRLYDREPGIRVKNFNTEWPCIAACIGACVL